MKRKLLIIAAVFVLTQCSNPGKNANEMISEAVEKMKFEVNENLQSFLQNPFNITVNPSEGINVTTPDGSRILVCPDAFVDANGNKITTPVNISYKPIRGVKDIIASGIPMQANNNGTLGQFISDGMFEINATSNGQNVQLAKGKDINVYTPSIDKNSEFKYWYFDPNKKQWEQTGERKDLASDNDIKKQSEQLGIKSQQNLTQDNKLIATSENNPVNNKKVVPTPKPVEQVFGYNKNAPVLDFQFDKQNYPELTPYNKIMWQFAETGNAKTLSNNEFISHKKWSNVQLTPSAEDPLIYNVTLLCEGSQYTTKIRPVLTGKDLDKARKLYAEKLATLNNESKQIEKDNETQVTQSQKMADMQTKLYNTFSVSKMGVFNCDRFYSDNNAVEYSPTYTVDNSKLGNTQTVYVLLNGKKDVIQFNAGSYKMRLRPEQVDAIITVLGTGVIAAVSPETVTEIKQQHGGKIKLAFEKIKQKLTQGKDLTDYFNSL